MNSHHKRTQTFCSSDAIFACVVFLRVPSLFNVPVERPLLLLAFRLPLWLHIWASFNAYVFRVCVAKTMHFRHVVFPQLLGSSSVEKEPRRSGPLIKQLPLLLASRLRTWLRLSSCEARNTFLCYIPWFL